jgi:hypothetical protein
LDKNTRPYSKNKAKRTGGIAQVVEHLPSNCKALSSTPQYCQINKIKNKNLEEEKVTLEQRLYVRIYSGKMSILK